MPDCFRILIYEAFLVFDPDIENPYPEYEQYDYDDHYSSAGSIEQVRGNFFALAREWVVSTRSSACSNG